MRILGIYYSAKTIYMRKQDEHTLIKPRFLVLFHNCKRNVPLAVAASYLILCAAT